MTAYAQTGRSLHHGLNEQNLPTIGITVSTAMVNADTMAIQLPAGVDPNLLPTSLTAYSYASPTATLIATIGITSHNTTTGITTLTATGAVPAGSYLLLDYAIPPA